MRTFIEGLFIKAVILAWLGLTGAVAVYAVDDIIKTWGMQ